MMKIIKIFTDFKWILKQNVRNLYISMKQMEINIVIMNITLLKQILSQDWKEIQIEDENDMALPNQKFFDF
ncbi:unnamed protein product [Paramecium sonneborni]|uniref:Uncharacterized protein n=1 Tax=Paramecium sonneborni TaxID=65129 RepID=A0A8S1KMK3_9CILI|nr:unnamed protein product [Paramecium sonneborni]